MKKRHGVVISKTGLIIGLLSLSLVAIAGQAQAAIQCYDCHGDRQAGILKPKDTYLGAPKLRDETTGAFLGNHQTHLGAVPSAADCVKCHNNQNYTNSHATSGNFKIQMNPKLNNFSTSLGAARYGKPTSFDQTSDPVTATCSNVNCHFVSKPTDQWGTAPYATADTTTCNKCHDALPNTHAHTTHISKYGNDLTSCANCHSNHVAEAKPFQHATSAGRPITVINGYAGSNNAYLPGQINRVVGTCSTASCHANVYGTGTVPTPAWNTTGNGCTACHSVAIGTTGPATGSHDRHNITDCTQCHTAGTTATTMPSTGHADGDIDVTNGYPVTAKHAAGTYAGTCSTASCHSNVYGTGSSTTPVWGTTGNGCSSCHSVAIGTTGPDTGSHAKHNVTDCTQCHAVGTTATTVPSTGHADGDIDVTDGYPANVAKHTAGSYSGTCATASCHANVYGTGTVATPTWGTTAANCTACHTVAIGVNGPNTGSHAAHAGKACTSCHAAGTSATTMPSSGHNDNNITVTVGSYPATVAKHTAGSGYSTCSNISCHSSGAFTSAAVQWGSTLNCKGCHATLSAGHGVHVSTLLDDRASTLVYDRYSANASSDATYKFGCANCHPVTIASHINGTVDVDLATTAGSGNLKANNPGTATYDMAGTKKCSNVYCHSNGYASTKVYTQTPAWGGSFTGDRCAGCHGNSPSTTIAGSPAHSAHAVGIHYDDIFDGVSGKYGYYSSATKPSAHGDPNQATIISCDICHTDTVETAAAGKNANDKNSICVTCHSTTSRTPAIKRMAHINGTVDVKFASVNVRSKAQIRETSFSSYTSVWSRTSYKVDSGSYDTAKKSLTQATFTAGGVAGQGTCATVSCHNGYTVNWNDSLTCESCHSRL